MCWLDGQDDSEGRVIESESAPGAAIERVKLVRMRWKGPISFPEKENVVEHKTVVLVRPSGSPEVVRVEVKYSELWQAAVADDRTCEHTKFYCKTGE